MPMQRNQQQMQQRRLEAVTGADILKAIIKDNVGS
ncbi:Variable outer membrane protein (plasmid) [Borrelia nietonii YOR]|uniref:Variable outer membrane protein n=2 Tax=Borrelia TaxID=138 RepID=W5SBE3_9SPIR|nr:Variable outer membrane protein [Borrelia nietonii YOR]AHH14784.1 Variable outer membrane protein [Borrelia hermsii MTW]